MLRQPSAVDRRSEAPDSPRRLPPATPAYILRGHGSAVHALSFYAANSRLLSGDAEGWVIAWDVVARRAVASWRAHAGAILRVEGVEVDGEIRILTHGRDHKLRVWRLNPSDEERVDKVLPANRKTSPECEPQPWLLHSLDVNALNFCAFSYCRAPSNARSSPKNDSDYGEQPHFYIAVPNSITEGGIDVFHLPSQRRVSKISPESATKTGMLMAVSMFVTSEGQLCVVSGYEEGTAMVHVQNGDVTPSPALLKARDAWSWKKVYSARAHSQPVLSLSVSPGFEEQWFITSSADATLAKHPLPGVDVADDTKEPDIASKSMKTVNTKHAGQQGLTIRHDGKIFATAGWDHCARVYSCDSMRELAVLKWHSESCFALAFADPAVRIDAVIGPNVPVATNDEPATGAALTLVSSATELGGLASVKQKRSSKATTTHWLAAGGKDSKISLWDIY